jgi:hypothetical protein
VQWRIKDHAVQQPRAAHLVALTSRTPDPPGTAGLVVFSLSSRAIEDENEDDDDNGGGVEKNGK